MVVYSNSRYSTSKVAVLKFSNNKIRKFLHHRKIYSSDNIKTNSSIITLKSNTELDIVSFVYYGKESKYWFIADVNNVLFPLFDENLIGPSNLHIGSNLYIPSIFELRELS